MVFTFQKILLTFVACCLITTSQSLWAKEPLHVCQQAPLVVMRKEVGHVTYVAENCQQMWNQQSIQLRFSYTHAIPDWAFKRAALHLLKKNLSTPIPQELIDFTESYRPIQPGDQYTLNFHQPTQRLTLNLNQQKITSIQSAHAQQYFLIWFGSRPFSATLKAQLLQ